jgi:hypothetical protein
MTAYRTAIDRTSEAIERRARYFRNQVVIVVLISAFVAIVALVTRLAAALWAWLLLVPACGLFLYADDRALNAWRSDLLAPWITGDIDFAAFRGAIRANPALPKGTTEGMLITLPPAEDLVAEQKLLTPTRQAIAAASLAIHRHRADVLLLNALASGIITCVLLAALWTRSWVPLLTLTIVVLLAFARAWTGRRRQARCEAEVAMCRAKAGFSESDYARTIARLR